MIKFKSEGEIVSSFTQSAECGWQQLMKRRELGFWQLPERDEIWQKSTIFANEIKKQSRHLVVIGMGGSALGGRCLVQTLTNHQDVSFLNNLEPRTVAQIFDNEEKIKKAHFLIISKTGSTLEIACLLDLLLQRLSHGQRSISEAVSVITEDKSSPLLNWAKNLKLNILEHPQDVGGRFSAFTPVGLVPAAFAGVQLPDLRIGLKDAVKAADQVIKMSAYYLQSFERKEFLSIFWSYIDQMLPFSNWLIQLWSESLAKKIDRAGQVAAQVSTPLFYFGSSDQHSVLQQLMEGREKLNLCFLRQKSIASDGHKLTGLPFSEFEYLAGHTLGRVFEQQSLSTESALIHAGRTTSSIEIDQISAQSLAHLMLVFELIIGVLGECLNINAFDQPGVEIGKKITIEKLQKSPGH